MRWFRLCLVACIALVTQGWSGFQHVMRKTRPGPLLAYRLVELYRSLYWQVRTAEDPIFRGHCIVALHAPRRCLRQLTDPEIQDLWQVLQQLRSAAKTVFATNDYALFFEEDRTFEGGLGLLVHLVPCSTSLKEGVLSLAEKEGLSEFELCDFQEAIVEEQPYVEPVSPTYEACPFCSLETLERQCYGENAFARILHDWAPVGPFHSLVTPKRCVQRFDELEAKEFVSLVHLLQIGIEHCTWKGRRRSALILQKNGDLAGRSVKHLHFHIIPYHSEEGFLSVLRRSILKIPEGQTAINSTETLDPQTLETLTRVLRSELEPSLLRKEKRNVQE